jgi:hypothetical protein
MLEKRNLKRRHGSEKSYQVIISENELSGEIHFRGFEGETSLDDIKAFELQNPEISVSVFGHEGKQLIPLHVPQEIKKPHVDLLLLKQANYINSNKITIKNISFNYHFLLILDIHKLCD